MSTATKNKKAILVGLDLGTNTSVFVAAKDNKRLQFDNDVFPTLVGSSKPGIIPGILPSEDEFFFGETALEYRLHLDLNWPLTNGFIDDIETANRFCQFIAHQINPKGDAELWAVIGAPANASADREKDIRRACSGVFQRTLVVPEPFLAAMGLRDDERAKNDPIYVDPTKHSLIIDIGAGTTDCCLVQGYYPSTDDQISIEVAGDAVDREIQEAVSKRFPDVKLTRVTVTQMKEKHSFVNKNKSANVKIYVDGKPRTLDFSEIIKESCEILIEPILDCIRQLLRRCDSDVVENVLQNIIIAGGGSDIDNLPQTIQKRLRAEGYDMAFTRTPEDYRRLVAEGALKIGQNARDDQWQLPL